MKLHLTLTLVTFKGLCQSHSDFDSYYLIKALRRGESFRAITFDLSDLDRSESRSLRFRRIIFRKGAELGHMVLSIIGKYVWGSIGAIAFDFRELDSQGHSYFQRLISRKGSELGHVLLLYTNRK